MLVSLRASCLTHRVDILDTLPAESYTRTPPMRVYYGDEASQSDYAPYYAKLRASDEPRHIYRVRDAIVHGPGIITLDGKIVRENLEGAPVARIEKEILEELSPQKTFSRPLVYVMKYGMRNFGHCLVDILPRLQWFHRNYPKIDIAVNREVPFTILEALALAGIERSRIVVLDSEPVHLNQMYFMDLWNRNPLYHSPSTIDALLSIREVALSRRSVARTPRKLFITRGDARTRHLLNHEQLSTFLLQRGYTELQCGRLSMQEQIEHFATAESIVGIAGAALTNIVFCTPGTQVTVLAPSGMPALFFWDLASHSRLRYCIGYFQAEVAQGGVELQGSQAAYRALHADFRVSVDALKLLLE